MNKCPNSCQFCLLTAAPVALLLGQLDHRFPVLCRLRIGRQLAQHGLPLRLCLHLASRYPHPQPWRAQTINSHSRCPDPLGKLDQIRRDEGGPQWELRGRHVWAAVDRLCSAICALGPDEVFRLVVHQSREDSCYGSDEPGKPIWWCVG